MNKLYDEIMEGKHDKILGVVSLASIITAYALSGIVHKIKNKKERDTAFIKCFLDGYAMCREINKPSRKYDRKWVFKKVKLRLFLLSRNLHVI